MSRLLEILTVWFFGGIGAVCRYIIIIYMDAKGWSAGNLMGLPTLVINVPACFLIGLFAGLIYSSSWNSSTKTNFALMSMTGFCGGFSTFSSYTLDSLHYFDAGKLNIWVVFGILTLFVSLFACAIGYWIGKKLSI